MPGGVLSTLIGEVARIIPMEHPPEVLARDPVKPAPPPVKPPRITQLRMATPIHKVEPVYPALARQARVSGTVELLGVLGTDGRIHELKVLRGHPLLINAALEAVRQWIFEPTLLNGQAVEVAAPDHGELRPAPVSCRPCVTWSRCPAIAATARPDGASR